MYARTHAAIDEMRPNEPGTQIRRGRVKLSANGTTQKPMANGSDRPSQLDYDILWITASSPQMVVKPATYSTIGIKCANAVLITLGPEPDV
jgi:hypothetical protein